MADEEGFSLLGALAGDLAEGLAQPSPPPSEGGGDDGSLPSPIAPGPWRPRTAITRTERTTERLPEEAHRIAGDLLAAVGLLASATTWHIQNRGMDLALETASVIDIGRDSSRGATFLVQHPVVSRLQCRVELTSAGPSIVNLGSVNPAFVRRNGLDSPVGDEPVLLAEGDAVMVGDDVLLFTVRESTV